MSGEIHGSRETECEKQEEVPTTKVCSKCKEQKAVTEFHKNRSTKDGWNYRCKSCRSSNVNKKKQAEIAARWYRKNREYSIRKAKEWQAANKERKAEYDANYSRNNKEKISAKKQRRRARKRNASGYHTAEQWKARLAYHGYKCIYCGVEKHETPQGWLTCEHLIPLSRGGTNWASNLAPACTSCNSRKYTRTHFEYLEYLNDQENI